MKKVDLNKERCIGCGACISIAAENFTFGDDGRAEMINNTVTEEAIEASEMCPVSAITIDENCECENCNCEETKECTCEDKCNCGNDCNCEETKECTCEDKCNCGNDCNCTEDNHCGCKK